jgi:hypothetical protein
MTRHAGVNRPERSRRTTGAVALADSGTGTGVAHP